MVRMKRTAGAALSTSAPGRDALGPCSKVPLLILNETGIRGGHGRRPPCSETRDLRRRNTVERLFNTLKHVRAIATRYDKTATSCEAAVSPASSCSGQDPFEDGP